MTLRAARRRARWRVLGAVLQTVFGMTAAGTWLPGLAQATAVAPQTMGELDCNGYSPVQQSIRRTLNCTDIRGITGGNPAYTWGGRFYDNGHDIGHDEPDTTFYSRQPGTGNDVTWSETLPVDPVAAPTVKNPGNDVAHWFELSVAPWFSMARCDSNSYPLLPCVPQSDRNAPSCPNAFNCPPNSYPGGGSAFMEMQFYPPGFAPFADAISCDNTH